MVLALLILFLAIANVSAEDTTGNLTVASDVLVVDEVISLDDNIYHITNETFNDYIADGEIADDDMIYEFEGDFEELGVLYISGNNITVKGSDANFVDTVFYVIGDDNTLVDINMEVFTTFKDNENSAIYVDGDNTLIDNLNLYYFVPANVEAYGIQVSGTQRQKNNNFQLRNSLVYFEGHNYYSDNIYDYGIFLFMADNAIIFNNTLQASLPLRNVSWDLSPSIPSIYRDFVLNIGVFGCDYLNFTGNNVITSVNEIGRASYPTLDAFYIEKSNNCIIENNSMYTEDFVTPKDIDNYLYGIDIYGNLTNLTVNGNLLIVNTTGGTYAHGTAYPVQLTGPLSEVYITKNTVLSYSNGPNIGIYSQNTAGSTNLVIERNFLSITGLAGSHEWALVSGIEAQDTNDRITNNIIEVHSIDEVSEDTNLYGISYRQSTDGEHSFNVVNNTVFSNGYYAVAALDAQNSNFEGNTLYTDNDEAVGKNSLKIFDEDASSYSSDNNNVKSIWDYLADEYNTQDGGEDFEYETPSNVNNRTNEADASSIVPGENNNPSPNSNPLLPKSDNDPEPSTPSILVPDVADGDPVVGPVNPTIVPDSPDGDPTYVKPTINYEDYDGNNKKYTPRQDSKSDSSTSSDEKIERQYEDWDGNGKVANATHTNSDGETDSDSEFTLQDLLRSYVTSNTAGGSSPTNSYNGYVRANNTQDNSPSVAGDEGVLGQSESSVDTSSASSVGQSSQSEDGGAKAYEVLKDILENNSNTIIPSVGIVLIALFLLVVGYRRKQSDEN